AEPEVEEGFDISGGVLEPGGLRAWLEQHAAGGRRLGVAFTGQWARGTGDVRALALSTADGNGTYLDVTELGADDEQALAEWLSDARQPKAAHDAKGPLHAVRDRGWSLAGLTSDTALAAYLVRP